MPDRPTPAPDSVLTMDGKDLWAEFYSRSEVSYAPMLERLRDAVLAATLRATRPTREPSDEEIAAYKKEATTGDYDHLLQVTMQTVDVI